MNNGRPKGKAQEGVGSDWDAFVTRLTDSIEQALRVGEGLLVVSIQPATPSTDATASTLRHSPSAGSGATSGQASSGTSSRQASRPLSQPERWASDRRSSTTEEGAADNGRQSPVLPLDQLVCPDSPRSNVEG